MKLRKGIAFTLIASMLVLSACGKKGGDEGSVNSGKGNSQQDSASISEEDKNYVYKFEELKFSDEDVDWSINRECITSNDNAFYMIASNYGEIAKQKIFKLSNDSEAFEEIDLKTDENTSYGKITCDKDGNLYVIKECWTEITGDTSEEDGSAEDTDVSENADDENSDSMELFEDSEDDEDFEVEYQSNLVKLSPEGETLWEVSLSDGDDDSYVNILDYINDLGVVTVRAGQFTLYNPDNGESSELLKRECIDDDNYYDGNLIKGKDGKTYLLEPDQNYDEQLFPFNVANKNFEEKIQLPTDEYFGFLYPGKTFDFYVLNNDGLGGFNVGDTEVTKVCDFTLSDALYANADFVIEPFEGTILIYGDEGEGDYELARMTKVDPKDVIEKETLTIGMVGVYDMVRKQIVKFNKNNDKYRLKIVDYSSDTESEEDFFDNYDKLNLDITSGNAPDLIVIDYYMPWKSYAAKGVLEPLDSYFENDEEISKKKFLDNILNATKIDGKQYVIVPCFGVSTCVGAEDKIGSETVTLENYEETCNKMGIDPKLGMGQFFKESGSTLYTSAGDDFIDYETGKCNFNSEGFISLLKMMNNFPSYEDTDFEDYDYEKYESYYRENKSLLLQCSFYDFDYYQATIKGYFGKDIVFNGFPGDNCGKSFIDPRMQIAMSSTCKDKEMAWQFLKAFLSDDFQKHIDYGFPVTENEFDALVEKAQEKPYYIDEKGEKHETSSSWSIAGMEIEITELSKEEAEKFGNFVKSLDCMATRDNKINTIIEEEAGAYYSGQKTAEEVADIIQSRVSIYLSENM